MNLEQTQVVLTGEVFTLKDTVLPTLDDTGLNVTV